MKKSFIFASAFVALTFVACSQSNEPAAPNVTVHCCCNEAGVTVTSLPGVFSVSPTHMVRFAPGNLQYSGSSIKDASWRFADEQYIYLGYDNSISSGRKDLFGFGQDEYGKTYMHVSGSATAYSTSYEYWGGYTQKGASSYVYGDIYDTNWDWGVYCAIENGGNKPGQWRTLTKDEWEYLMKTRPNAASSRGYATVDGKHGYLLLPDGFVMPAGLSFDYTAGNYTTNVYCYQEWKRLEAAGAVFLPCTGTYDMSSATSYVWYPEYCAYYWTSSKFSDTSGYAVAFGYRDAATSMINMSLISRTKYYGCAVRLAQDVN